MLTTKLNTNTFPSDRIEQYFHASIAMIDLLIKCVVYKKKTLYKHIVSLEQLDITYEEYLKIIDCSPVFFTNDSELVSLSSFRIRQGIEEDINMTIPEVFRKYMIQESEKPMCNSSPSFNPVKEKVDFG